MTDQTKKDLAQAYEIMLAMSAWKHFETQILDRLAEQATKDEDAIPVQDLDRSIGLMGVCRGKRLAIVKIKADLDYILQGLR